MLVRLWARVSQGKRLFEALLTLVSCGEFQMVLNLIVELGMIVDTFFLTIYLTRKDWLKPANPDLAKLVPEMLDLIGWSARLDIGWSISSGRGHIHRLPSRASYIAK
jgi:hypothetical protein